MTAAQKNQASRIQQNKILILKDEIEILVNVRKRVGVDSEEGERLWVEIEAKQAELDELKCLRYGHDFCPKSASLRAGLRDDTPAGIVADWYEERGKPELAAAIRRYQPY